MKFLLFSVFVITGITNCFAQLWKPYVANAKCIYGYTQNSSTTKLIHLRYDSLYSAGTTEVAYAFTKSYSNDSCLNAAHKSFRFDPFEHYPDEWVSPFPIEIKQTPDSIISSTFILMPNTPKGRQPNGDVYEKDSIMDILGIADSVKIYFVENYGRIILSKYFGLVKLDGYVLMGFQTDSLNLGLKIPPIETRLQLKAGDILYHRTLTDTLPSHMNGDYLLHRDTRDSITTLSIAMDTLSISVMSDEQNYFVPSLSFNNRPFTYRSYLPELNNLFQDGPPVQKYNNLFYVRRPILMNIETDTVWSVELIQYGLFGDCTFGFIFDICHHETFSSQTLFQEHSSCSAIFGGGSQTTLIGSRISNKVTGHINLSLQNPNPNIADISIFPNPASDVLYLNTNDKMDYDIVDILGNQQLSGQAYGTIPVQSLATGLYILRLQSNGGYKTMLIHKN